MSCKLVMLEECLADEIEIEEDVGWEEDEGKEEAVIVVLPKEGLKWKIKSGVEDFGKKSRVHIETEAQKGR
jgi:hypothetical protein